MMLSHRKAHRRIWTVFAVLVPVLFTLAVVSKAVVPGAPVLLAPAPEAKP